MKDSGRHWFAKMMLQILYLLEKRQVWDPRTKRNEKAAEEEEMLEGENELEIPQRRRKEGEKGVKTEHVAYETTEEVGHWFLQAC